LYEFVPTAADAHHELGQMLDRMAWALESAPPVLFACP